MEGLKKVFRSGSSDLVLFDNLSFQVRKGEMLAIVGESGTGKSSLLHLLGTLDRPTGGDVYCANLNLQALSQEAAAEFRNREIGFVWQFHYLLPEFTALENIAMPLLLRGWSRRKGGSRGGALVARSRVGGARPSSLRRAFRGRAAARLAGPGAGYQAAGC